MLQATGTRVLLLLAAGTVAGGWFGCSSRDKPVDAVESVSTTQQALEPSGCDPDSPFEPAQPAFTGYRIANGVAFSADGRTAYVSAKTGPTANYAINVTRRDTTSLPFAPLAPVTVLNSGYEDRSPWLSSDGLRMYLTSYSAATSWQRRIAVATREPAAAEFADTPQFLPSSPPGIVNYPGVHNQDAFFLGDKLYYASEYPSGTRNIYAAPFDSSNETFGTPVGIGSANMEGEEDHHPVLSPNELTLYFSSTRPGIGGDNDGDIYVTRRTLATEPFNGPVSNLYGLNTSYEDYPVTLTDNGCTLYFASAEESGHGVTNMRLYRATRAASVPSTVTTTIKIVGTGSVTTAPFQCSSTCTAQGAPEATVMVQASGSAHWSGSCAAHGSNPGGDGIIVFTKGGVCTVDFRSPGNGTPGSLCFADRNCTSGLYCTFNKCGTGAACDPDAPFGPISQVFSGDLTADGFTLSADEKTAYVSRKATDNYDIYVTTRNSTSDPFVTLTPVTSINSPYDDRAPWLSDDGQRLYFWKKFSAAGDGQLVMSVFNTATNEFGAPELLANNSSVSDEDPFLLPDEKTLFFTSDRPTGDRDLWVSTRSSITEAFTLANTTKIPEVPGGVNTLADFEEERRAVLTPDGLTMYFHSDREGWNADFNGDIWIAKRTSTTAPFGTPVLVEGVNYSGREFPVALSRDSCTLYFASNRDTGAGGSTDFRLYRASRCVPICDGVAGGEYDGCGGTCPYGNPGDPCTSNAQCAGGLACVAGVCATNHCENGVKDADETDVDCGGSCSACGLGKECGDSGDCAGGLDCGENNGACFGRARGKSVCWSTVCADGIGFGECGATASPCGQNCSCVTPCDADDPTGACPEEEECKRDLGRWFRAPTRDVCLGIGDNCPSNNPEECGTPFSKCGTTCVCRPDCSTATCADPSGGCPGNVCPGVCGPGEVTPSGGACTTGHTAYVGPDGVQRCRGIICTLMPVTPPLCGTPGAECGEECPVCEPPCGGQSCGPGTCEPGLYCDANGQCAEPTVDSPPTIPSPTGPTPIVDLPDAPTTPVGALSGSFDISELGTAQYTIPIEVPPGRAGMEPALSLVYSGGRTSGDSGIGWHLEGLSKITRCAHIQALDGYSAPVKNDPTDVFCVDGKRLSAIEGTYGDDGTEYRTIVDSFAKIISYRGNPVFAESHPGIITPTPRALQGPDWFRIWTKDGRILTYGRTRDSLVMSPSGIRYNWLLNRVEDRAGNNILVNYENFYGSVAPGKSTTPTVVRPSSIFYTGSGDASGNRQVAFGYEDRPDPELHYRQGGMASVVPHRLKTVTTAVNGEAVRTYRLSYSNEDAASVCPPSANTQSQIRQVFECAGAGGSSDPCKPPTTFCYKQEQGFTWDAPGLDLTSGMQLDVNGDGVNDFIVTDVTVNGKSISPELQANLLRTDVALGALVIVLPQVGIPAQYVWRHMKSAFWGPEALRPEVKHEHVVLFGTGDPANPTTPVDLVNYPGQGGIPTYLLDHDRDGKDDIGVLLYGDPYFLVVHRSAGNGTFIGYPEFYSSTPLPLNVQGTFLVGAPPVLYDVDGDSLQDIVSCKNLNTLEVRRRLSPSEDFADPISLTTDPSDSDDMMPFCGVYQPTYTIIDIDGDGTPELFAGGPAGWNVLRYSLSSAGEGQIAWEPVEFENVEDSYTGAGLVMGDLNGDGLVDITKALEGVQIVWLNTGNGEFIRRSLDRPSLAPSGYGRKFSLLDDYDADGRLDLLEHWRDSSDFSFTQALLPDGWVTSLTPYVTDDIKMIIETPGGSAQHPGRFSMSADIDGDGNLDLFGDSGVFYGSGANNTLLEKVTDGLGNLTSIRYDADAYVGTCPGSTWPETCTKRLSGLVSGHSEGFIDNRGDEVYDRVFEYKYENARYHTAGHGWLGFERRTEEFHEDGPFTPASRTTTIEYEPPSRYTPDGVPATDLTQPYLYPLAGMIRRVIVDESISPDGTPQPLETTAHQRRTRIENHWDVGISERSGTVPGWRPFPKLMARETEVYDRALSASAEDDGQLLTTLAETFNIDLFGRVHDHIQEFRLGDGEAYETYYTVSDYLTDPASWLISQPTYHAAHSARIGGHLQSRSFEYGYENGLLKTVKRFGPEMTHTTTFDRDAFGNPFHIVESVSTGEQFRETTITYDADNVYPATVVNPLSHIVQMHFDDRWGTPATIVDPNNVVVQHSYDGFGLRATTIDAQGTTTYGVSMLAPSVARGETAAGTIRPRVRVEIDRQGPGGSHAGGIVREIDHRGRVVRTMAEGFDGVPVISEQLYDHRGRIIGETRAHIPDGSPVPSTLYTYDRLDRLTGIQHSDGTSAQRQYASRVTLKSERAQWLSGVDCGNGGNSCVVDLMLEIDETIREKSVVVFDHRGLIVRSIDGNNLGTAAQTSDYTYGGFGQLTQTHDNLGVTRIFTYDSLGRLIHTVDPETNSKVLTYNAYDELKTATDTSGRSRTYTYDPLGRLRVMVDPAGTTTWTYDDGVNARGRLTSMSSPPTAANPGGQRVDYIYEPVATPNRALLERVDYVIDGINYPIAYDHDDLGRTSHIDYPDLGTGSAISIDYDYDGSSGVLRKLTQGTGTAVQTLWEMTAAFQGHLVGTEVFGSGVTTNYDYTDQQHWLNSIHTKRGSEDLQKLTYTHTGIGQVFTKTNGVSHRQVTYDYDALDRLLLTTEALEGGGGTPTLTQFGYDDVGNLTQRGGTVITYQPGGSHYVNTVDSNSYGNYTLDGNLFYRSGPDVPGESQLITYTSFDLPSTVFTGSGEGTQVTQFEYSADEERLVRRDMDGTRHFVGGLYQRLADPSGVTQEERFRLVAGSRLIGEIVRAGGTDKTQFFHTDHLGSPQTISTAGESTVVTQEFGPFGEQLSGPSTELTRSGFTGHDHDRDLGLIDMKGRVYDPLAGSFLSADPVLQAPFFSQGLNPYAYVFNDPINNTDPSGFESCSLFGACYPDEPAPSSFDGGGYPGGSAGGGGFGLSGPTPGSVGGGAVGLFYDIGMTLSIPTSAAPSTTTRLGPSGAKAPTSKGATQGGGSAVGQTNGRVGPTEVREGAGSAGSAGPINLGSNIGTIPCNRTPEECGRRALEFQLTGGGFLPDGALIGVAEAIVALWRWLLPAPALTSGEIGGSLIRWGTGQTAEAVAQTNAVTQNLTREAVRQMVKRGLTRGWVEEQLALYRTAALDAVKAAKNVQLAPRTALMEKILELWPK